MIKYKLTIIILSVILAIIAYQKFFNNSYSSDNDYKQFLNKNSEVQRIKKNGGASLLLCYFSQQIDDSTIINLVDEYSKYENKRNLSVMLFTGKVKDNGLSKEINRYSEIIVIDNYDLLSNVFKVNREGAILFELPNMKALSRYNNLVNPFTLLEELNEEKIDF